MSKQWIVGINPVASALDNDAQRVRLMHVEQGKRNQRVDTLVEKANQLHIPVEPVKRDKLNRLIGKQARHQGIAVLYEAPAPLGENDLPALIEAAGSSALFLLLDGVTDPHNLGACLRSAVAAGATAVIAPKDKAVGITPAVRRASAGGVDQIPWVQVTNLRRAMDTLKEGGVWLTGLTGATAQSLYQVDLKGPVGIVMGSEGDGLRQLTQTHCDYLARIPMPGTMESLNVSVATGIALFEVVRQRM